MLLETCLKKKKKAERTTLKDERKEIFAESDSDRDSDSGFFLWCFLMLLLSLHPQSNLANEENISPSRRPTVS